MAAEVESIDIEKAVEDIIRRHIRLFAAIDEIPEELDLQVVQALKLEQVLEKAATLESEENLDDEEKARFLTAIVS